MEELDKDDLSVYSTSDIQEDYAVLLLTFGESDKDVIAYRKELERRGERIPVNIREIFDPFAYMKKRVVYELSGE